MKRLFAIVFILGGLWMGCEIQPLDGPETEPVEILSMEFGTGARIINFYATGIGQVSLVWFAREDSTGVYEAGTVYQYVDGENNYSSTLPSLPNGENGYYNVIAYDTNDIELASAGEMFSGWLPTCSPEILSFTANRTYGTAPLTVTFAITICDSSFVPWPAHIEETDTTYFDFSPGDGRTFHGWFNVSCEYAVPDYEQSGIYTPTVRTYNKWGSDQATGPTITVVEPE